MSFQRLKLPEIDDRGAGHEQADPPTARPAIELLAEAVLHAALTTQASRTLKSEAGRVVILVVPAAAYVTQVGLALGRLSPAAYVHTVAEKKRKGFADDDPTPYFGTGRTVLAVTQDRALLHASLHVAADLVLTLRPPDVELVLKVINIVTRGRARGLVDADVAGRDLDQIAAAIRPGSTARECVERLKRLGTGGSPAAAAPDLAVLPLFDEAKAWAAETLADLERLQRLEIAATDLEHVLLYGPPGTGKTLLARALAKAAGVRFFDTSVAAWFTGSSGHLDGVLKAADAFFQTLLDNAPCLGLLDELEALPDRGSLEPRHREWWNSIITGVLLMVTRVRESGKPILLVGATNYAERVDAALKRPGRLGRHVLVRPAATEEEVAHLFAYYLGADLDPGQIAIAAGLAGTATPAQVEGWVKAARRVVRDAQRPLLLDDLLAQIAPPDVRGATELRNVALHEAGHAVAALVLGHEVKRVSIVADGSVAGVTTMRTRSLVHTLRDIEDEVVVILSGRAADELLGGGADSGASADLELATTRLAGAEASLGLRDTLVHRADDSELRHLLRSDPELLRRIDLQLAQQMRRAVEIVELHRDAITRLADALVTRRVIGGVEVMAIVARVLRVATPAVAGRAGDENSVDTVGGDAQSSGLKGQHHV